MYRDSRWPSNGFVLLVPIGAAVAGLVIHGFGQVALIKLAVVLLLVGHSMRRRERRRLAGRHGRASGRRA